MTILEFVEWLLKSGAVKAVECRKEASITLLRSVTFFCFLVILVQRLLHLEDCD